MHFDNLYSHDFARIAALEHALAFHVSGHVLHSIFWKNLSPDGGGKPTGELAAAIDRDFGSFDKFIWQFVEGKPLQSNLDPSSKMIVSTKVSDAISKDLKKRGFRFVGTTIIYALMQATGLVNDHTTNCYRFEALNR